MDRKSSLLATITYPSLEGPGAKVVGNGTVQFEKVIGQVIGVLTIVAVLYFIFVVIIGGYNFISAQGDEKQIEMARKQLTNGVLGITIVIIALGLGSLIAFLLGIPNILDINSMFSLMGL